jgi:hypothetical protein
MSDDTTDHEASTRELVVQILERVGELGERMGRVEAALGIGELDTQPLSGRVNRLLVELAEFKLETHEALDDVERSIASIQRDDVRRWTRLDERVQLLEHPEGAKP